MTGLPEITIAGTLVADPELRFTPTGAAVANFTVAANDRRYDTTTNQWVDKGATFLRCSIWRTAAENLTDSLTKGTRVLLTGVLRQREWHTPEGEKRYGVDVDVTEIGASLKWATVTVAKTTRTTPRDAPTGTYDPGAEDPWASTQPAPGTQPGPGADEPPF